MLLNLHAWIANGSGVARKLKAPNPGKKLMVGIGVPITDYLHVLPFHTKIIIQIGLSYELSTPVAGCSIRIKRAVTMSLFSMCMMVNCY